MTTKGRQQVHRFLFRKYGGLCTCCGRRVVLAHAVQAKGWVLNDQGMAYHPWLLNPPPGLHIEPAEWCLPIATIEHIKPRSMGGSNNPKNLTLHCWVCNMRKNDAIQTGMANG